IDQITNELNMQKQNLVNPLNQKGYHLINGVFTNVFSLVLQNTEVLTDVLTRLEALEKRNTDVNTYDNTKPDAKIDIPDGEIKLVSFRMNNTVYDLWKQYTASQKLYKSQDLMCFALLEYMQKHK
ncbi:MAG: hypothetical protein PHO12_08900, partial [Bacteroidales bacterium]|nr:hypothetical protein [Bacteroidales bacterium]